MCAIASKQRLMELLKEVDRRLHDKIQLYLVGGASLIGHGLVRATEDIDVIFPHTLDTQMARIVKDIAIERQLDHAWLNTQPSHLARLLAKGWQRRAKTLFTGRHLKVWIMGRQDLIGLKIVATLERFQDKKDLLALKPTAREWEAARKWAGAYPANPGWSQLVDELVQELRKEASHE